MDILEDGSLDQDEELLAQLDVVVASVHSKLRMESGDDRTDGRRRSKPADGHPGALHRADHRRARPEALSFDPDVVFAACAGTATAVEINSRPGATRSAADLLRRAVSRVPVQHRHRRPRARATRVARSGCEQAADAEVPPERIVNGWALDQFRDWTGTRNPG